MILTSGPEPRKCAASPQSRGLHADEYDLVVIYPLNFRTTFYHQKPMSQPTKNFQVAVIGGGVCGLACAVALHRAGVSVDVFEAAVRVFIPL